MKIEMAVWSADEVVKFDSVLDLLSSARVMSIERATKPEEAGKFILTEGCDDCFSILLNKEQLIGLGEEIIQLGKE